MGKIFVYLKYKHKVDTAVDPMPIDEILINVWFISSQHMAQANRKAYNGVNVVKDQIFWFMESKSEQNIDLKIEV